jgi:uncharacterized damage-inducible protein DinB
VAEKHVLEPDAVQCKEAAIARYLTMLADCRMLTIESIKSTREDLLYWRRSSFDNSISDLLYHIAFVEADWLFTDVLETVMPSELTKHLSYTDRDRLGRLVHIGEEALEASLVRLGNVRKMLNDEFSGMGIEDFRRLRNSGRHETNPEWVLHHLLQHEAEHRGQINLIKRLGTETQQGNRAPNVSSA